ncbi:MAG: hypothetical protein E7641_02765 [Ruminococcaceae bacterium]|nr:hypothetical protein [Oscillospiraceae bacterium]
MKDSFDEKKRMILAFRKYSRLGLSAPSLDAFDAFRRIEGCCRNRREAHELLAVYDTLRFLRLTGETDAIKALYAVYFYGSRRPLRKNDVTNRVQRHAYETSCDARTVYRRLSFAFGIYRKMLSDNLFD